MAIKNKKQDTASVQVCVRMEPSIIDRVDDLIEIVTAKTGRVATRSDVWREALLLGLAKLEATKGN